MYCSVMWHMATEHSGVGRGRGGGGGEKGVSNKGMMGCVGVGGCVDSRCFAAVRAD